MRRALLVALTAIGLGGLTDARATEVHTGSARSASGRDCRRGPHRRSRRRAISAAERCVAGSAEATGLGRRDAQRPKLSRGSRPDHPRVLDAMCRLGHHPRFPRGRRMPPGRFPRPLRNCPARQSEPSAARRLAGAAEGALRERRGGQLEVRGPRAVAVGVARQNRGLLPATAPRGRRPRPGLSGGRHPKRRATQRGAPCWHGAPRDALVAAGARPPPATILIGRLPYLRRDCCIMRSCRSIAICAFEAASVASAAAAAARSAA